MTMMIHTRLAFSSSGIVGKGIKRNKKEEIDLLVSDDACVLGDLEERNARIFQSIASTPASVIAKIKEEGRAWVKAGATKLQEFGILGDIT
uniref:Uncharacterized protein n=1 Tax=Oryza glumipatula TaxID=40148 RepID=A0A0E0A6D9_9ORYZ